MSGIENAALSGQAQDGNRETAASNVSGCLSGVKHTPGPWGMETVQTSVGICHKVGPFPSTGYLKSNHACIYVDGRASGGDSNADELLANARLIAAAPDLLEALRPFANYACEGPCHCNNCCARDAIARAEASAD